MSLTFTEHGACHHRGAALRDLAALRALAEELRSGQAGVRIDGLERLRRFLSPASSIGTLAAGLLGPAAKAVRAILFDKTADRNWSLAWHQDRTICVRRRIEVAGSGPWTIKRGMHHVAPPFSVLAGMVTLRVHLDDVSPSNAPLLIAPGSHREGLVRVDAVGEVVRRCGTATCLATAGDIWAYATPLLHASPAARQPERRRVLQLDFAAEDLPGGLDWHGP